MGEPTPRTPGAGRADEENDIAALGLAEALSVMTDDLERTLSLICRTATFGTAEAMGSAISLVTDERPHATASDHPHVRTLELLQYHVGDGPGLFAIRTGRPVLSASLGADPQWARFGPPARRLGIHSVMAVPLAADGRHVGALSCYAQSKSAFDGAALARLSVLAKPAGAIARGAEALVDRQQRVNELTEALRVRPVIDQAIGIIRSRTGKSEPEALNWLRSLSNAQHIKVTTLATQIVDEAVRRANARRRAGSDN